MQGFIKTEFSSMPNESYSSLVNKEKCSSLTNSGNNLTFGNSLVCRKKLEFDTATNQSQRNHKTSTPKKNTAVVAGTVQSQSSKNFENNSVTIDLKTHRSTNSQYPKIPSNTKRNARERKRVRTINDYFAKLQKYLPHSKPSTQTSNTSNSLSLLSSTKKLSKVETLKAAIDYIEHLLTFAPTSRYSSNSTNQSSTKSNMVINASLTPCSSSSPSSLSTSSPPSSLLSSPSSSFCSSISNNSLLNEKLKINTKNLSTPTAKSNGLSPSSSQTLVPNTAAVPSGESILCTKQTSSLACKSTGAQSTITHSQNLDYECFYPNQNYHNHHHHHQVPSSHINQSDNYNYNSYNTNSSMDIVSSTTETSTFRDSYYYNHQYAQGSSSNQSVYNQYLPHDVNVHVYASNIGVENTCTNINRHATPVMSPSSSQFTIEHSHILQHQSTNANNSAYGNYNNMCHVAAPEVYYN